ncbi:MAG: AraC family transcriptional regulator [Rhodobacteraceae bacterium]|nr:AraC family transcriptional regulator [Paracoccaceae bacterium]MCY4139134.1 AraC family transcriptional regulator [Paracoccaceae bacterium]
MGIRRFLLRNYVPEGEHYHFAQKRIDEKTPPFLHDHDYFEIFIVTRGTIVHWLRSRSALLEQGSIVFIRPGDCHSLSSTEGGPGAEIINIIFGDDVANHIGERYREDFAGRFYWHDRADPDSFLLAGPRFERAVNVASELKFGRNSLARIEEFLLSVMIRVVDFPVDNDPSVPAWLVAACHSARRPEVFRKGARGFVEAAGRGHEHVCRTARKHLGMSPSAYTNERRMEYAALMLGSTDTSIENIAHDCGIENLSHFYRLFRARYGVTPRRYRLHHLKDPVREMQSHL